MRPERLELPAYWFEASRSIQLSYGRTFFNNLAPTQCRIEVRVMDRRLHDFIREPAYLKRTARGGDPNALSCNSWICPMRAAA